MANHEKTSDRPMSGDVSSPSEGMPAAEMDSEAVTVREAFPDARYLELQAEGVSVEQFVGEMVAHVEKGTGADIR